MHSVYVETSIPSYYHETRPSHEVMTWKATTRHWWEHYRQRYSLLTSRFVVAELRRAPAAKAARALRLIEAIPILDEPPELQAVAEYYIEQKAMPAEAGGDAYHLAMASL